LREGLLGDGVVGVGFLLGLWGCFGFWWVFLLCELVFWVVLVDFSEKYWFFSR
jgi:hypothetical protein